MTVQHAALPKNQGLVGKTVGEIAKVQGKGIIDAFLDLVVEEDLRDRVPARREQRR